MTHTALLRAIIAPFVIALFVSCTSAPQSQLTPNEAEVATREAQLAIAEGELAVKETSFATRQAELATREANLVAREKGVTTEVLASPTPLLPVGTPDILSQEFDLSNLLFPFNFTISDVGEGWSEGVVSIAFRYTSEQSAPTVCLVFSLGAGAFVSLAEECSSVQHVDVSEINLETREEKIYPAATTCCGISAYALVLNPHSLPAGLIIDRGLKIKFRFAQAAHPTRLVIGTSSEQGYPNIVINLENVPDAIPSLDLSQYEIKSLADLAKMPLLDEQSKLKATLDGTCFHANEGYNLGMWTNLPFSVVNSNQLDEEKANIPFTFLGYYPSNAINISFHSLGESLNEVIAGPGQTVSDRIFFSDIGGVAASHMFISKAEGKWTLYKLDCEER